MGSRSPGLIPCFPCAVPVEKDSTPVLNSTRHLSEIVQIAVLVADLIVGAIKNDGN